MTHMRKKQITGAHGRQEEKAANREIAAILRGMNGWNVEAEMTDRVVGAASLQPDIIVESGGNAVIIETEYAPARTLKKDVHDRMDVELYEAGRPTAVMGVTIPKRVKMMRGDTMRDGLVDAYDFEYFVCAQDGTRFPEHGSLKGSLRDIAAAVRLAIVPLRRVVECVDMMTSSIDRIHACVTRSPDAVVEGIAEELRIPLDPDDEHLWKDESGKMAGLIMLNAGVFYEELATYDGDITPTQQLKVVGTLDQEAVVRAWNYVCEKIDYCPVFRIASGILSRLPASQAGCVLEEMSSAVSKISALRVQKSGDVYGMLYQGMLASRKNAAAFYTRPEAATLLAGLVMPASNDSVWDDIDAVTSWRIADFACGTGMLLTAAYQYITNNIRVDNTRELHPRFMEECVYGYDIMPTAVHLTVSNLAGLHPEQKFDDTHIRTMPIGKWAGGLSLGSLDLVRDVETFVSRGESVGGRRTIETHEALVTNKSCDYIMMNPPFVAATNHEGGREYAVPPFALFGITADDQRNMSNLLKPMYRGTCSHGNAGMASYFTAIADKKIKNDGVIGLVLPNTIMSGASWSGVRHMLNEWYDNITLVQVGLSARAATSNVDMDTISQEESTTKNKRDWGNTYSSDTGMNEVILVARKRHDRRTKGDTLPRIRLILLDAMPRSRLEALETAKIVRTILPVRLEDGVGHTSVVVGKDRVTSEGNVIGRAVDCPVENGRWWVGRVSDVYLLHVVYAMAHNGVGGAPMTTLGNMGQMGKIDRDLTGTDLRSDGRPRGPFNKVPLGRSDGDMYPCLWKNRVGEQMSMLVPPDCALEPKHNSVDRAKEVWGTASRLHMNREVDYRSQRLVAAFTATPVLGGRAWPNVMVAEKYEKALGVWCNSTLGILMYFITSTPQQRGRGIMTKTTFGEFPVPDFRMIDDKLINNMDKLFDEYEMREMLPVNHMNSDDVRIGLDTRMSKILDIEWNMSEIRTKLVRERQFGRSDL